MFDMALIASSVRDAEGPIRACHHLVGGVRTSRRGAKELPVEQMTRRSILTPLYKGSTRVQGRLVLIRESVTAVPSVELKSVRATALGV